MVGPLILGLSLLGASLGLEVVDRGEVVREESDALVSELERELTLRRNERPLRVTGEGCARGGAAEAEVLRCAGVEALVTLRFVSGIRRHRVVAALLVRGQAERRFEPIDVARATSERPELAELAREIDAALAPEPAALLPVPTAPVAPPPPPSLLPWVLAGTSVACLAVGLAFGASSRSARSELEVEFADRLAYDSAASVYGDRIKTHGTVANLLFALAGASALGAGGVWLFDP